MKISIIEKYDDYNFQNTSDYDFYREATSEITLSVEALMLYLSKYWARIADNANDSLDLTPDRVMQARDLLRLQIKQLYTLEPISLRAKSYLVAENLKGPVEQQVAIKIQDHLDHCTEDMVTLRNLYNKFSLKRRVTYKRFKELVIGISDDWGDTAFGLWDFKIIVPEKGGKHRPVFIRQ